jgi:hypothetical protein
MSENQTPSIEISFKPNNLRSDVSGSVFGPWKINKYVHHLGISPIWEAECIYCNRIWNGTLPKIKKIKTCECEERLKFTSGVYIINNIYQWYANECKTTGAHWGLSLLDLYKIYNRQNGVDVDGNALIFDYHWNYHRTPATCNYIWPDLNRTDKTKGYSLGNCYFVSNLGQRFKPKQNKK